MTDLANAFAERLAPYRTEPGMIAALLISNDGFVVASDTEPDFALDAFAAQASAMIDSISHVGDELQEEVAKYIAVEFGGKTMVLAPFADGLTLALIGLPTALHCYYNLG